MPRSIRFNVNHAGSEPSQHSLWTPKLFSVEDKTEGLDPSQNITHRCVRAIFVKCLQFTYGVIVSG